MSDFYKKMNLEEAKKAIVDSMISRGCDEDIAERFDGDEMENFFYSKDTDTNGYAIGEVDSLGGEGQGDDRWTVFSIKKDNETLANVKVNGWYCSYNGTEWDGEVTLVKPVEVMVIQWTSA